MKTKLVFLIVFLGIFCPSAYADSSNTSSSSTSTGVTISMGATIMNSSNIDENGILIGLEPAKIETTESEMIVMY